MEERHVDVVILGGAFSGSAAAVLLLRARPELSILVVEKQAAFDAKVGEATTEMSAMFLTRRLALWEHLEREHLPKEGLRYWFANDEVTGHADASETGAFQRSNVPSFQLRRDVLDEHLLTTAAALGARVARPARAIAVEVDAGRHRVTLEERGEISAVTCRWLLDATGRATFLGKRLGLIERVDDHETTAVWGRWHGVRHIDDVAALALPNLAAGNVCSRRLATNHYMGRGYWVWVIPLGNGETSIGIVYDRRMVALDVSGSGRADAYERFLRAIPSLAELLTGATLRREDLRAYSHLAYVTRQYMGDGWALLGDAAAFLDPYYSPGLDHAAFSIEATVELVLAELGGEDIAARRDEHNATFVRSYHRFFEAVYRDKYDYMGEADLLSASSMLDTAQYYLFVVIPAYRFLRRFHWMPVLGPKPAGFSFRSMRLYNRRFAAIARARLAAGEAGRRNARRRTVLRFDLQWAPIKMAIRGVGIWLRAELDLLRIKLRHPRIGRRAERPAAGSTAVEPAVLPTQGTAIGLPSNQRRLGNSGSPSR